MNEQRKIDVLREVLEEIVLRLENHPEYTGLETGSEFSYLVRIGREALDYAPQVATDLDVAIQALKIIAGNQPCSDNLLSDKEVAIWALKILETGRATS